MYDNKYILTQETTKEPYKEMYNKYKTKYGSIPKS